MNEVWKHHKEHIITVSIVLFGIVLIWYVIFPLQGKIRDQLNRSQELLVNHEMRNESVAGLAALREQRDSVVKSDDRLRIIVPKDDIVDLIKVIESLAKDADIAISIDSKDQPIQSSAAKTKAKSKAKAEDDDKEGEAEKENVVVEKSIEESLPSESRLRIAIKLTGSYGNIVKFVQRLESMPYETDVIAISMLAKQPDTQTTSVRSNIFSPEVPAPAEGSDTQESIDPSKTTDDLMLEATLDTVVYVTEP